MGLSRKLIVATTTAAVALAPLTLPGAADASIPFSVSVLHCGGGIAIKAFPTLLKATSMLEKKITYQLHHPASLHTIQLRHGSTVIKTSKSPC
jgi:hypothetical protein